MIGNVTTTLSFLLLTYQTTLSSFFSKLQSQDFYHFHSVINMNSQPLLHNSTRTLKRNQINIFQIDLFLKYSYLKKSEKVKNKKVTSHVIYIKKKIK